MRGTTEPPWWVPSDLGGVDAELNGVIVVAGSKRKPVLVCDCRAAGRSREENEANARLIAKVPLIGQSLLRIEDAVGDLPHGPVTEKIYGLITEALAGVRITRREDDDHG